MVCHKNVLYNKTVHQQTNKQKQKKVAVTFKQQDQPLLPVLADSSTE